MHRTLLLHLVAAALAIGASSCGKHPLSPSEAVRASSGSAEASATASRAVTAAVDGAQHAEGSLGPGALYAIDIPAGWNGDLVLYLHGYTSPGAPVALPALPLRDFFMSQGFAVAASSFSENGYAVAEGSRQSHQLLGVFADRFGAPAHTYLVGVSLGGIIGLELAEKHDSQFDGALLVSGVVGGSRAEVRYIGDVRVLFDYFFPGVVPGSLFDVPQDVAFNPTVVNRVIGAISTPAGQQKLAMFLACARTRGLPFANANEGVQATLNALGFQWTGAMDLFDRTHEHTLYDNQGVVYLGPGVPQAVLDDLNRNVARYASTPDAESFLDRHYEPDGDLGFPVVTLHDPRDPVVPNDAEALLLAKVTARGKNDLLLQRVRGSFGHVAFAQQDIPEAWVALMQWKATGTKPQP